MYYIIPNNINYIYCEKILSTAINVGTVLPSKGNGRQRTYNLHYGVTEFICNFKNNVPGPNEKQSLFKALSEKLRIEYDTYDGGSLKIVLEEYFVKIFCQEMEKQNDIYKGMNYWSCGSLFANLRVGRPLEADIAFELKLDENLLKVEYVKCLDIDSKKTIGEGTHLFCIYTQDQTWFRFKDANDSSSNSYIKIRSDVVLKTFQNDVVECMEDINRVLQNDLEKNSLKGKLELIGFKKHRRGVCAVLMYQGVAGYEGLLIDLVPILRLPNIPHPNDSSRVIYDVHAPRYQADRYREAMTCESSLKTDLFLLNELDKPYNQLGGAWSLTTSSIDHELLKLLPDDVKHGFRVVKFILQMYILEDRPEIRKTDPNFIFISAVRANSAKRYLTLTICIIKRFGNL